MKPKALHQPFELCVSDLDVIEARPLIYHFFEIVQILEGNGVRIVNDNQFPYHKGSIYLFTPLDCRGFTMATPTRVCSIRFSEIFLGQYRNVQERERIVRWLKQLEHIFSHQNRFQELSIHRPGDCQMIAALLGSMVEEYARRQPYYEENLQHLVTLILNILVRNVTDDTVAGVTAAGMTAANMAGEPLINRMLVHIRQHIGHPEELRVGHLAKLFNLSANYVGEYFRKLTGESLQHFITQYKIRLVQQRLLNSNLTVGQIADELGFTDESHLSRQFRKHSGMSPQAYRKNGHNKAGT